MYISNLLNCFLGIDYNKYLITKSPSFLFPILIVCDLWIHGHECDSVSAPDCIYSPITLQRSPLRMRTPSSRGLEKANLKTCEKANELYDHFEEVKTDFNQILDKYHGLEHVNMVKRSKCLQIVRRPVFDGLRTTKAQTSLRVRAVSSAPFLFILWKVSYVNLLQVKFQFSSKYM